MYQKSLLTGNIYFNGVLVPLDDTTQLYQDYVFYISNGGVVEEIESTEEEVLQIEAKKALENETLMYRKRQCDGVSAYAEISAEFRLAKLMGLITEEEHADKEAKLIPVRNEILAGQWISGLKLLEEIGVAIGIELYNRLHNQITNYIAENY